MIGEKKRRRNVYFVVLDDDLYRMEDEHESFHYVQHRSMDSI